jgi:hypothetical protein
MTITENHLRYGYVDLPGIGGRTFIAPSYASLHQKATGYLPVDFVKKYANILTFRPGPSFEDYPNEYFLHWVTASPFNRITTPSGSFHHGKLWFSNGVSRTASFIHAGATHIPFTLGWECWKGVCEEIKLPMPPAQVTGFPKLQRAPLYYTMTHNSVSYLPPWESWYMILGDEQPSLEEVIGSLLEIRELLLMEIECLNRKTKLYKEYAAEMRGNGSSRLAANIDKCKSYIDAIERILPTLMQMHLAGEKPPVEHVVAMARGNVPLAA